MGRRLTPEFLLFRLENLGVDMPEADKNKYFLKTNDDRFGVLVILGGLGLLVVLMVLVKIFFY